MDEPPPYNNYCICLLQTHIKSFHTTFGLFALLTLLAMSRHHPDLLLCRRAVGISLGMVCDKCDGKCPICDSYVRPHTQVRICDQCNYGSYHNRCIICSAPGVNVSYYCSECVQLEKDRDGCPKIINLGSAKTDLFYEKKKYAFKPNTNIG